MDEKLMDGKQHFDDDDNDMINWSIDDRGWSEIERERIVLTKPTQPEVLYDISLFLLAMWKEVWGGQCMCKKKSLHSTYLGIQRVKYFYKTSSTN